MLTTEMRHTSLAHWLIYRYDIFLFLTLLQWSKSYTYWKNLAKSATNFIQTFIIYHNFSKADINLLGRTLNSFQYFATSFKRAQLIPLLNCRTEILKYLLPMSSPTDATNNLFISAFTCPYREEILNLILGISNTIFALPGWCRKRTKRFASVVSQ